MSNREQHHDEKRGAMTFRELCALFPEIREMKLPTAKYLRENTEVLWEETIWGRKMTMYADGHFTYSDGITTTVQSVRCCARPMKYTFVDGSTQYITEEYFMDKPYQLRLGWEGDIRIERNEISKANQKKWSSDNQSAGESIDNVDSNSDFVENWMRLIVEQENRERLKHALNELTKHQRDVVVLYFVEKMSQKEIGERLGCTKQSVSECINAALKKLRKYFDRA